MKFLSILDVQTFLLEIKEFDKVNGVQANYQPTNEELTSFIKSRSPLVSKLKNYRKSADQKANWRGNRTKMMKGIKAFHKSVDGKRFHRRLGRFMATRITRTKDTNEDYQTLLLKQSYLKGLNSAKQHLFVELEYFHQLQEQVELEDMIISYAIPMFQIIENKIVTDEDLSDDELVFLMDLTDNKSLVTALSDKTGVEFAEIENMWDSITSELENEGVAKDDPAFYPSLIDKLKSELGLENG